MVTLDLKKPESRKLSFVLGNSVTQGVFFSFGNLVPLLLKSIKSAMSFCQGCLLYHFIAFVFEMKTSNFRVNVGAGNGRFLSKQDYVDCGFHI
jgi:hypothetical protein